MWQIDKSPEAPGRIDNLKELVSGLAQFESLPAFLEHVALVLDNQDSSQMDCINIMTLHGAKGLEFDAVFLPGWEEGLFPSQRSMDEHGLKGLEEERRLAYVGLTRARWRAFISYVANRRVYGNYMDCLPSRFIDELPENLIETGSDLGFVQPGRSAHWDSSGWSPAAPAKTPASRNSGASHFEANMRISHDSFGQGRIIHVDGQKLDILFDDGTNRRVMAGFVEQIA
jgi:DNA helicase-2/ATP-dependent DNA helicase PcrA